MIYLDTHIVVWLYAGTYDQFSDSIQEMMNEHDLLISPIVRLELQYLYEINRINAPADTVITDLYQQVGLNICQKPFDKIAVKATQISWTRDPFDRMIVAHASLDKEF